MNGPFTRNTIGRETNQAASLITGHLQGNGDGKTKHITATPVHYLGLLQKEANRAGEPQQRLKKGSHQMTQVNLRVAQNLGETYDENTLAAAYEWARLIRLRENRTRKK